MLRYSVLCGKPKTYEEVTINALKELQIWTGSTISKTVVINLFNPTTHLNNCRVIYMNSTIKSRATGTSGSIVQLP